MYVHNVLYQVLRYMQGTYTQYIRNWVPFHRLMPTQSSQRFLMRHSISCQTIPKNLATRTQETDMPILLLNSVWVSMKL